MKLITQREQIKQDVADVLQLFIGMKRRKALKALNLETCSIADIQKAYEPGVIPGIGILKCDECQDDKVDAVIRFNNPKADDEWTWDVCQGCLENAVIWIFPLAGAVLAGKEPYPDEANNKRS